MSQEPLAKPAESRGQFARYTIRSLFGLVAVIALGITALQFAWPRRIVQTSVLSPTFDISLLEPHLDQIAEQSQTIRKVKCDPATNSIILQAQARHIEAAEKEIELIMADPSVLLTSESLGITMQEARELVDER